MWRLLVLPLHSATIAENCSCYDKESQPFDACTTRNRGPLAEEINENVHVELECQPTSYPSIIPKSTNSIGGVEYANENSHQCGLYVAPSSISGAGLGTFSGIEFNPDDIIDHGDASVPVYDVLYHLEEQNIDPMQDYLWHGLALGMQYESSHPHDHISGIAYGLTTIINCHPALVNVDIDFISYDFADLHRSIDPGIGAFTPYHSAPTIATHHIAAGSELFKSYGDEWFTERSDTLGVVPLTEDYSTAELMLKKLQIMFERVNIPDYMRSDIYDNFILSNRFVKTSPILLAMPKAYADFQRIVHNGIRDYYQRSAIHTLDYLQEHGRCVDMLQQKRSQIRQAGRGAFARRPFQKDSIVIGTPFIFHPNDDYFKLYEGNWITKNKDDFHPDQHIGYQLLYNYCWRHEFKTVSSIVLCPYGMNVNFINHNQSLVNVRLQWARDGELNHNTSLLLSHPREMYNNAAPQLWLDFVALRDIEIGEEIYMDYGSVWEEAWQAHMAKWNKNHLYPTEYVSASDWNKMNTKAVLRTSAEQVDDPYPEHFMMVCLPEIANPQYVELLTSTVCERAWDPSVLGLLCYIIDREQQSDGSYWYQVRYRNDADDTTDWIESDWIVREAIRFVNERYTNDIFLRDAFRQPIGIPDEIFPDAWRGIHLPT